MKRPHRLDAAGLRLLATADHIDRTLVERLRSTGTIGRTGRIMNITANLLVIAAIPLVLAEALRDNFSTRASRRRYA